MTKRSHSPSGAADSFYAPFNPYDSHEGNLTKKVHTENGALSPTPHIATQALLRPESIARMTTKADNLIKYETPSCERLVFVSEKDANGNTTNQKDFHSDHNSAAPQFGRDRQSAASPHLLTTPPNAQLANLQLQIAQAQARQNVDEIQRSASLQQKQQQMQQQQRLQQQIQQQQQQQLQIQMQKRLALLQNAQRLSGEFRTQGMPSGQTNQEKVILQDSVQDTTMETPTSKASSPNYYCSTKDTMYTKLFVGGLPYHTCDKTLREHFEQYGDIDEAVVITDKSTNKSRGYGFVTMSDREGAQRAVANPNPVIDGRKANVNLAFLGAKQRGGPTIDYPASLQQFLALKAAGWPGCGFVQAGQSTTPTGYPGGYPSPYGLPMYYPGLIPYGATPSAVSPGSSAANQQFWDYTALANAQAQATESAAAQLAFPYMTAAAAAANPLAAAQQQVRLQESWSQQGVSPMSYAYIPATAQTVAAQAAYQSQQLASADQLH